MHVLVSSITGKNTVDTQPFQENHSYKILADALQEEAKKWINKPYRHLGRTKRGVDCIGLVICLYKALKFNIPEGDIGYAFSWMLGDPGKLTNGLKKYCDIVKRKNTRTGDICSFAVSYNNIDHVGLWLDNNIFIHSCILMNKRVAISDIRQRFWNKKYVTSFRPFFVEEQIKQWAVEQLDNI